MFSSPIRFKAKTPAMWCSQVIKGAGEGVRSGEGGGAGEGVKEKGGQAEAGAAE